MSFSDAVQSALSTRFGLFPRDDWQSAIEQAARDMEPSTELSAEKLLRRATTDIALLKLLAGKVTVSESFFFRQPEQLDLVVSHIQEQLREPSNRQVRVWSAGCSGGEEPLSLAMLLTEVLESLELNRVHIEGNDIDAEAISSARSGLFSSWSFRGLSELRRRTYFSSEEDGRFRLTPDVGKRVLFEHRSIQEQLSLTSHSSVDVLMFRNVGIYLTRECLETLHSGFHLVLKEGGLLCTAPSDPPVNHPDFEKVDGEGGVVYQKKFAPDLKSLGFRTMPCTQGTPDVSPSLKVPSRLPMETEPVGDSTHAHIAAGQEALNQQDFNKAEAALRKAVFSNPVDPESRFWYALTLFETGSFQRSKAQLNAALSSLATSDPSGKLSDGRSTFSDLEASIRSLKERLAGQHGD